MTDLEQPAARPSMTDQAAAIPPEWTEVCPVERIPFDRGVAALIDGVAVAVFRLSSVLEEPVADPACHQLYAVSHIDPASGSPVMARGLIGSAGQPPVMITTLASPLDKKRFNLRTGVCLDDETLHLTVFDVDVTNEVVRVRARSLTE